MSDDRAPDQARTMKFPWKPGEPATADAPEQEAPAEASYPRHGGRTYSPNADDEKVS